MPVKHLTPNELAIGRYTASLLAWERYKCSDIGCTIVRLNGAGHGKKILQLVNTYLRPRTSHDSFLLLSPACLAHFTLI